MKVKELIEQLQKFDPEQIVVVDGYETGYDEVKKIYYIAGLSKLLDNKAYYDGQYQKVGRTEEESELLSAVYIPRSS
jgi:GTP-dependent phosphoenolpyruvate carboxykinase